MRKIHIYILSIMRLTLFVLFSYVMKTALSTTFHEIIKWWTIILILVNIFTIFILNLTLKKQCSSYIELLKKFTSKENFKKIGFTVIVMSLVGTIGMFISAYVFLGQMPDFLVPDLPVVLAIFNIILFPLSIVLAELPLYFGYIMVELEKATMNKKFAISFTIITYALQHAFMPFILEIDYMFFRFFSFVPLLIIITIMFEKRRSLYALMIGHFVLDFSLALQVLIYSII